MRRDLHLDISEIAAFLVGRRSEQCDATMRHLLICRDCRSILPLPDPTHVWAALRSERDFDEPHQTSSSKQSRLKRIVGLFYEQNRLAWAGSILAVVAVLAVLFIFSVSNKRSVETEMARSLEFENPVPRASPNRPSEVIAALLADSESGSEFKGINSISTDRKLPEARRRANSRTTARDNRTTSGTNRKISSTRGAVAPCSVGRTIEMELRSNKSDLVLRWKRVPKAAKYHLYVSDDSEILVDEFETDQATSYVLKKPLDLTKFYKWKIAITLESGEKLYVDAQKFTAKDFQSLNGYKSKARSNTRCLAN